MSNIGQTYYTGSYMCVVAIKKFNKDLGNELLSHPPYSTDSDPGNFSLFPNLNKWQCRKKKLHF